MDTMQKERIRMLSPIWEVVGEVIPLRVNVGRCPKHDDRHPSFSVDPKRGLCRCWVGCTDGSLDVFGFCQWYYGDTFPEALERLARRAGVPLEPSRGEKTTKRGPYREIEDLLMKDKISYLRWKREALEEVCVMQAILSQKVRKRNYAQYERGIITQYGLERGLSALERMDEKFDELDKVAKGL